MQWSTCDKAKNHEGAPKMTQVLETTAYAVRKKMQALGWVFDSDDSYWAIPVSSATHVRLLSDGPGACFSTWH